MQQQDKSQQAAGAASESADVQFLAENKTKAGVKNYSIKRSSIITKEGTGKQPAAQSMVKITLQRAVN